MVSPDPREHKRLGLGVNNFDCAIWDRVRADAVLLVRLPKFTQNPAMKQSLLSTGTKFFVPTLILAIPQNGRLGSGRSIHRSRSVRRVKKIKHVFSKISTLESGGTYSGTYPGMIKPAGSVPGYPAVYAGNVDLYMVPTYLVSTFPKEKVEVQQENPQVVSHRVVFPR